MTKKTGPQGRLRLWVHANSASLLTWSIVLGSFVVQVVGRLKRAVTIFPDSRYYIAMTLRFAGKTPEEARALTQALTEPYGITVPDVDVLFGWGLVQPRVVLPLLAAFPTRMLGVYRGLMVTVLAIALLMVVVFTAILIDRLGNAAAIVAMLLINTSFLLSSWNLGMLTESLSALWTALTLVAAFGWVKYRQQKYLWIVGLTVLASAFTRQATLIVAGALVGAWLIGMILKKGGKDWMWPALVASGTSIGAQVVQTLVFPFSQAGQFMRMTETDNLWDALLATPRLAFFILRDDVGFWLRADPVLMVFILLALASMVIFYRHLESHLLFGALLAIILYNISNGNPTGFRYAVPGLVFFALSVGLLVNRASDSGVRVEASSASTVTDKDNQTRGEAFDDSQLR